MTNLQRFFFCNWSNPLEYLYINFCFIYILVLCVYNFVNKIKKSEGNYWFHVCFYQMLVADPTASKATFNVSYLVFFNSKYLPEFLRSNFVQLNYKCNVNKYSNDYHAKILVVYMGKVVTLSAYNFNIIQRNSIF